MAEKKLMRVAGLPAVSALFASAPERVERLFFTEKMKTQTGSFTGILARRRKPYRLLGDEELERVAGSVMHGGVVAFALPAPIADFDPSIAAEWARDGQPLVMLDGIGNPQNLGAIIRSAAFFGHKRIVLSDHPSQALPSDAAYRIAQGGMEHIELYRTIRFATVLKQLHGIYRIIGTALEGGVPMNSLPKSDLPDAIVLGNEERGLPGATLKACDAIATIPGGGAVQSLNVAASAAIFLYALTAHRT
jgi:TrmH RNA methyltransferase